MKILGDLLCKPHFLRTNYKHRRLTIGFYLVSYDIYLHKQAISRRKNCKTPVKTAINCASDNSFYPDPLLRSCRKEDSSCNEILSLLKPGSDSYPPGNLTGKYYSVNGRQSHGTAISWESFF